MNTNDNNEGFLAIFYWKTDTGTHYRARGSGPIYNKFYAFLRGVSYVPVSDDFPWDYFYISDYAEEVAMVNKFGKYMSEDPSDNLS